MHSVMFFEGGVTDLPANDVNLECAPNGAGLHASAFEQEMPRTSKIVSGYSSRCVIQLRRRYPPPPPFIQQNKLSNVLAEASISQVPVLSIAQ